MCIRDSVQSSVYTIPRSPYVVVRRHNCCCSSAANRLAPVGDVRDLHLNEIQLHTKALVNLRRVNAVYIIQSLLKILFKKRNILLGSHPVSYTHLDVYKRQGLSRVDT